MNSLDRLEFEFLAGEAAALDPDNESVEVEAGRATTTLQSPWLHLRCRVCGHTFRPGDRVEVDRQSSGRRAVHAGGALHCSGAGENAEAAPNDDAEAFFTGLEQSWPPPKGLPVFRPGAEHFLTAPPRGAFRRRACAVCGHTFRPHDQVIPCPCFPSEPRCQVAIHRDPVTGLHCYDDWNPGAHLLHCPATSRKLSE